MVCKIPESTVQVTHHISLGNWTETGDGKQGNECKKGCAGTANFANRATVTFGTGMKMLDAVNAACLCSLLMSIFLRDVERENEIQRERTFVFTTAAVHISEALSK